MAYCRNCGSELQAKQDVCLNCGTFQNDQVGVGHGYNPNDTGGAGWGLLGFCIPIVGLILYLIWKDERPNTAKAAGIGALIGFILNFVSILIASSFL